MLLQKFWQQLPIRARERIYILPTISGTAFLLFTIALLLMGAIYNSQLVNLLAFLLLTLYGLSMVMTHQNLQGLSGFTVGQAETFAGEDGVFEISFKNRTALLKEGLVLELLQKKSIWPRSRSLFQFSIPDELTERPLVPLLLPLNSRHRGRYPVRRVRVSTTAPLGLFRAWRTEAVDFDVWVYPRKVLYPPQTIQTENDGGDISQRTDRAEAWADSHPAEFGGSVRRMDWTRFARTDQAWVRPWNSEDGDQSELDWDQYPELLIDDKLSHFSYEVDQALRMNLDLRVKGPWGDYGVDKDTAKRLFQLWAEWEA